MPVQRKVSVLGKLNVDSSVKKHANDETNYGFIRMPGGVRKGVAQLEKCGFGVDKNGQPYFRASGVAIEPEQTPLGEPVRGLSTSIFIPVADTKNSKGEVTTRDQNIQNIMMEMRRLGGEDFTNGANTGNDLEDLAAALENAQPYFYFSTTQSAATEQYPNPRVWENWHGTKGLEDYVPPTEQGTKDNTPTRAQSTAQATANGPTRPRPQLKEQFKKAKSKVQPKPKEPEEQFDETNDLNGLAAKAQEGDSKAAKQLEDEAERLGIDANDVRTAETWAAVVELIMAAGSEAESETESKESEESSEEAWDGPKVEDIWKYAPVDPKTRKAGKPIECEVMEVDEEAKTCSLKNLANPKLVYKKVNWDSLVSA